MIKVRATAGESDDSSLPSQEDYDAIVQSITDYAGGWMTATLSACGAVCIPVL